MWEEVLISLMGGVGGGLEEVVIGGSLWRVC